MTNSLLTNTSAMIALQNLRTVNKGLSMVQEQISTGKKVANAKDNAAIFAISTVMQSDVKGFEAISQSLNLGASSAGVARGAAEKITELLVDMKGLIVAAQEDNIDRTKIQTDIGQLREQIDSIVDAAQFNGLNFLKGTSSTDFLASLDRDSGGTVTASFITVDAYSLETTAGAAVAGLDATTTGVNGGGDSAAQLVADTNTFALDIDSGAVFTAGDVYEVRIDGRKFTYAVETGDDETDIGQAFKNMLDAAGISGRIHHAGVEGHFAVAVWPTTEAHAESRGITLHHSGSNTMNYAIVRISPAQRAGVLIATNIAYDGIARDLDQIISSFLRRYISSPD